MRESLAKDKRPLDVEAVHEELEVRLSDAESIDDLVAPDAKKMKAGAPKAISIAAFAGIYKSGVRQALVSAGALLKFFHRGDAANGIAQAVAFLDLIIGGEVPAAG